jgi:poly(3-hydroxybutyrate) depolymerase
MPFNLPLEVAMKVIRRMLCCLVALGLSVHFAAAAEPVTMKWTIDGVEREALVFAPAKQAPGGKAPLVFGFHGHGGTMHMNSLAFGFQNL